MKTFFCLGNKWIAHLTQLFTHVLRNRCTKSIRKLLKNLSSLVVFLMFSTHILRAWWLRLKNLFKNFAEPCYEEHSCNVWSVWQHHIPRNIFSWKLYVILICSPWWQQDYFDRSWNLSTNFKITNFKIITSCCIYL